MELTSNWTDEAGQTVDLIDAVITLCNIISTRDFFDDSGIVQEAIKNLRSNDGMKRLMDIGELQAAKDYIQEQKTMIKSLLALSKQVKGNWTDEDMLQFHQWLINSGWQEHSSKEYWYKQDYPGQWPTPHTCLKNELIGKWKETYFICDMCGKSKTGERHQVYDENFNLQKGLIQCSECLINKWEQR